MSDGATGMDTFLRMFNRMYISLKNKNLIEVPANKIQIEVSVIVPELKQAFKENGGNILEA
jgi:hypothetical protein